MIRIKIISTGYEGSERAALDAAIDKAVNWGGYTSVGLIGISGPIGLKKSNGCNDDGLVEYMSARPTAARIKNISESDATLFFGSRFERVHPICKAAMGKLRRERREYMIANLSADAHALDVAKWIMSRDIKVLNISAEPTLDKSLHNVTRQFVANAIEGLRLLCKDT